MADPQQTIVSQTSIPDYARPYVENVLGKAQAVTDTTQNPFQQYQGERVAQFTPLQQQGFQAAGNMQASPLIGQAAGIAQGINFQPGTYANQYHAPDSNYQAHQYGNFYNSPGQYASGQFNAMGVDPNSQAMQVGTNRFTDQGIAGAYMSPYMQQVVDTQKRELMRDSSMMGQNINAQAAKSGAFGGSRHAIMEAEHNRNTQQRLGDVQAQGMQQAFQQGMQQYSTDAARGLQAGMANQGANLTATGQNLQGQMANQNAGLQAQNMGEQSRQFGFGQAMQGAAQGAQYGAQSAQLNDASRQFAQNQAMQSQQLNAQYGLAGQQLGEQSRQFGAGLGLQGATLMGNLGNMQYGQNMGIAQLQGQMGTQQQQNMQNVLNTNFNDFNAQQNHPYQQLAYMSDMLRGLPLTQQSQQMYSAPPSTMSQIAGAGLTAYGLSKNKKGGVVKAVHRRSKKPEGLAALAISKMGK